MAHVKRWESQDKFLIRISRYEAPVQMLDEKERSKKEMTMEAIVEGRKMDAYVEHRTKEMHICWVCGSVGYKKLPMRSVGDQWICINCLRGLKETLDSLKQWEAELELEEEMSKTIDESLNL